jgi:hypothetical protein
VLGKLVVGGVTLAHCCRENGCRRLRNSAHCPRMP